MKPLPRQATVTCKGDVELLVLTRHDYISIFMNFDGLREPEHITFLRHHELFNTWPVQKLPWFDPTVCIFTFIRYTRTLLLNYFYFFTFYPLT